MAALIKEHIFYPEEVISIPYPANCKTEDLPYFDQTSKGPVRACRVLELTDVFANWELILWKDGKMLPEGFAHAWIGENLRNSKKDYLKVRIKRALRKRITVEAPVVWCLDGYATGGYYHWVNDILPRLWMVKDYLPGLKFALPDYFLTKWPFVKEFLDLLDINNLLIMDSRHNYLLKQLILPTRAGDPFFRQDIPMAAGINWLKTSALSKSSAFKGDRLYISRSRANYRKVINEADILPVLHKFDFQFICLEDYSLADQISICSKARVIMSIHGAGIVNMVFMPAGGKIIEIRPRHLYHLYNCFHTLSYHTDAEYNALFCDYAPSPLKGDRRIDDHSVVIDPALLEKELYSLLSDVR